MDSNDPFWTPSRVVPALVVVAYVVLAAVFRGGETALRVGEFCLLPLMCIWFPDFMGNYRGWRMREPSPPVAVFVVGWLLLLTPAVVVLVKCLP